MPTKRIEPLNSVRLFTQACVGVLVGVLLAMLIARLFLALGGRPHVIPHDILPWNINSIWLKPREKGFYLLVMLLGPICAFMTTARVWNVRLSYLWLGLFASIPLVSYLAGQILQGNHLRYVLMVVTVVLVLILITIDRKAKFEVEPTGLLASETHFQWKPYLLLLLAVSILLLPASFTEVAAHIGMEAHMVSFLIAPAIYSLGDHLLPGVDYFTQYSVGMGWFFSHILSTSAENAVLNYVRLVIIATWFFYAQLIYVLYYLYRSWAVTSVVTLLSLVLLFHTSMHFFDPSSSILRYPLLGVCAWLLGRWIMQPRSVLHHLALGCGIALSLFLNTETGIITVATVIISTMLSVRRPISMLLPLTILGSISLILLISLMLAVFGTGIFQKEYIHHLIEPLLVFAKAGFGGMPISWTMNDLNWFYNLVAPGAALATLALVARSAQCEETDRQRFCILAFFTVSGMLMMAKYVNMAIIGVWQMSALGLLVPIAWWGMVVVRRSKNIKFTLPMTTRALPVSAVMGLALLLPAFWLATFSSDIRNPSQYGFQSWVIYPSYISSFFRTNSGCNSIECVDNRPSAKDIALITERTRPGEAVAIIDLYDWTYLVSAHRPAVITFMPSAMLFTWRQLNGSVKKIKQAPYLFLPVGADNKKPNIIHVSLQSALLPTFEKEYVFDGQGERLVAWRRKKFITDK